MYRKKIINALDQVIKGDVITYTYKMKPRKPVNLDDLIDKLGMDREQFAAAFRLSKYSVRNWELGVRKPQGPALTLLQMIQNDPIQAYKLLHPDAKI